MAKKKEVVINPKAAPGAVEAGDVNIYYHHTLIGSLSDDGNARLETEDTICEHDIGVEYTKPGGTPSLPTLTVTKNDLSARYNGVGGCPFVKIEDGNIINSELDNATNYIPNPTETGFEFYAAFKSPDDNLMIIANGNTAIYSTIQKEYEVYFDLDDYNTPVTLSITNKPNDNN